MTYFVFKRTKNCKSMCMLYAGWVAGRASGPYNTMLLIPKLFWNRWRKKTRGLYWWRHLISDGLQTWFLAYLLYRPLVLWHCWLSIRKGIWPVKIEWWSVDVVICLEQGADVRLFACGPADSTASQHPIISCLIYIQTDFTFLVPAYPGVPGKRHL